LTTLAAALRSAVFHDVSPVIDERLPSQLFEGLIEERP
jgi:hypothetical protein